MVFLLLQEFQTLLVLSTIAKPMTVNPVPNSSKNFDSRTRDHLANERTYLAWMRTTIALMGFGVVIARLRSLLAAGTIGTGQGRLMGLLFAGISLVTIVVSTQHYFAIASDIDRHTYQPRFFAIFLFSSLIFCLGGGVIFLILSLP